jgi:hypothetical protein
MLQPKFFLLSVSVLFTCLNSNAQEKKKFLSTFRDSLDNKIDLSDWLVNKKGVLLMLRRSIVQC